MYFFYSNQADTGDGTVTKVYSLDLTVSGENGSASTENETDDSIEIDDRTKPESENACE